MAGLVLTNPSLGSLFAIPAADWTTVSQRVGYTARLRDVASLVAQYLPDFPTLLGACDVWRATTFPLIVKNAASLRVYSQQAHDAFASIQTKCQGLDPIPPELQVAVAAALTQLAVDTGTLAGQFQDLATRIATFTDINQKVDAEVDAYSRQLGPFWSSVLAATNAFEDAAGLVRGTWDALRDDLDALVDQQIDVTAPFIANLEISSALTAWVNLEAEADAFDQIAPGQDQYLTGAWLG